MRKAILHLKKGDPLLAAVIGTVGPYRMDYREPCFETLVRSIIYQQLSGKAAATILGRLVAAVGDRGLTPEAILRLKPEKMRALGLSTAKTAYVRDLAEQTKKGKVRFDHLCDLCDDDVIAELTQVKGVGVWTAQMFLMFALRRPDILPLGDLGVRAAMKRIYGLEDLPKPAQMIELATPWRPFASVASWYLWRSLDGPAQI